MRRCRILLLAAGLLAAGWSFGGTPVVDAAEPYEEFLAGLRQRGYHDTALEYLESLENNPATGDEFRVVLPYEKATTLMALAATLATPEAQNRELNRAQALLEQFATANPQHDLAGHANSQRARILLSRAKVEIWQSQSPSNEGNKAEFQQRARELLGQARKVFQQSHDQYHVRWESFPKFIDAEANPEQYEARKQAELGYMLAQYDLAKCTYEEAQAYDPGDKQYKATLTKASREFEELHSKYRLIEIGLVARAWQGKCYEELGDLRVALGIYKELLGHPGDDPFLKRLQDQVLHFQLICQNKEERHDYQLVIQQAEEWLVANRGAAARSEVGLGIRWEQATAQEKLAEQRGTSSQDRNRLLRDALAGMKEINRYPGQYKDLSMFRIRQLTVKLRGKEAGDPEDFDTAFGLAREMVNRIGEMNDAVAGTKDKQERAKLEAERSEHLAETARYLNMALEFAGSGADVEVKDLNLARVLLSFVYYQMRESYRAAILGEFVANHYADVSPKEAQDGAFFAMAAYVQAYNESKEGQKDIDLAHILRVCNLITEKWPNSDRANDAMRNMGSVLSTQKRPLEAAAWFSRIPESAANYSQAQFSAGQAYWTAYATWSAGPEAERASSEERLKWMDSAEQHLRTAIARAQAEHPASEASPASLIAGKVSLGEILLEKGEYEAAIKLLQDDPHAVIKAIVVDAKAKRPSEGVQSAAFASAVYQSLLRGFVGTQQLDKARATMQQLEAVTESGGGEAVTEIYKDLGKKLQDELQRLHELGDDKRLAEVRSSFEKFLNDMYERKDQTYGSLVWIAETYYGLGEGTTEDVAKSNEYFTRAGQTFQTMLESSGPGQAFELDDAHRTAVQLRLAACRRRQGQFEEALKLVGEIIAKSPNTLSAQIEAARTYQDWAAMGQADAAKHFQTAITGTRVGGAEIWGWGTTGQKLQRLMATSGAEARERFEQEYFDARYNAAWCRFQSGLEASGDGRKALLTKAKVEIQTFASLTTGVDDEWWAKFDSLYRQVLEELGETAVALERPTEFKPVSAAELKAANAASTSAERPLAAKAAAPTAAVEAEGGGYLLMSIIGLVLLAGGGYCIYAMMSNSGRRKSPRYSMAGGSTSFSAGTLNAKPSRSNGSKPAVSGGEPAVKRKVAVKKPGGEATGATAKAVSNQASAPGEARVRRPVPKPKPADAAPASGGPESKTPRAEAPRAEAPPAKPSASKPSAAPKRRPPKPE